MFGVFIEQYLKIISSKPFLLSCILLHGTLIEYLMPYFSFLCKASYVPTFKLLHDGCLNKEPKVFLFQTELIQTLLMKVVNNDSTNNRDKKSSVVFLVVVMRGF